MEFDEGLETETNSSTVVQFPCVGYYVIGNWRL